MSLLLDHCVPRKFLHKIRSWGYDATQLQDHMVPDAPDTDVIALAQQLDSVLLTIDLDFANIFDYPPVNYVGIIVIRYQVADETALMASLHQTLADLYRDNLRSKLVIVEAKRYRIRS